MKYLTPLRRSLAARLALVYGLISVAVVTALGLGVYLLTERYLLDRAEDDLAALADFYVAYTAVAAPDEARLAALAPQIATFFAPQADYDIRLFSARSGTLLAASRDIGRLPSSSALAELQYRRPTVFIAGSQDLPGRLYVARPSPAPVGGTGERQSVVVVEISRDMSEMQTFLGVLRLVLIGAGGLILAASLLASLVLARQMARPLRQMESATQAIAAGDFGRRLDIARPDEIGRLAASVNQMAADLGRLESARREFIAKVSHDLRTPLTAIKGFVVNLLDTAPAEMRLSLATMDEQTDRVIRLVDDLLALARLQRGELRLRRAEIDLAAVARSAAAVTEGKARRLGVTLALDLPEAGLGLFADADRLQQVVVNLLDNALRATPTGGTIRVQARADGQGAMLTVCDDGSGLTPEEAEHAFEPYFRGQGGGAGLGLTIARDIVQAHGGYIWLKPRAEGGAEAGFVLPRCRQEIEAPLP
jgi:signal transduction histidine kinase